MVGGEDDHVAAVPPGLRHVRRPGGLPGPARNAARWRSWSTTWSSPRWSPSASRPSPSPTSSAWTEAPWRRCWPAGAAAAELPPSWPGRDSTLRDCAGGGEPPEGRPDHARRGAGQPGRGADEPRGARTADVDDARELTGDTVIPTRGLRSAFGQGRAVRAPPRVRCPGYIGTLMPRLTSQAFAGQDVKNPIIMPTCMRSQNAAAFGMSC